MKKWFVLTLLLVGLYIRAQDTVVSCGCYTFPVIPSSNNPACFGGHTKPNPNKVYHATVHLLPPSIKMVDNEPWATYPGFYFEGYLCTVCGDLIVERLSANEMMQWNGAIEDTPYWTRWINGVELDTMRVSQFIEHISH